MKSRYRIVRHERAGDRWWTIERRLFGFWITHVWNRSSGSYWDRRTAEVALEYLTAPTKRIVEKATRT